MKGVLLVDVRHDGVAYVQKEHALRRVVLFAHLRLKIYFFLQFMN